MNLKTETMTKKQMNGIMKTIQTTKTKLMNNH